MEKLKILCDIKESLNCDKSMLMVDIDGDAFIYKFIIFLFINNCIDKVEYNHANYLYNAYKRIYIFISSYGVSFCGTISLCTIPQNCTYIKQDDLIAIVDKLFKCEEISIL